MDGGCELMGRIADQFAKDVSALEDRIQARIDRIRTQGMARPPKSIDSDIAHLLETLERDEDINLEFECGDGELSREASRMITTARRLVREAGYALPETVGGAS